jgi:hypothetical protein
LEAVKEALPREFELLGKSVTRNRDFLESRITHALGSPAIAQDSVQHFVCMDLRLLFFLALVESAIAASDGIGIYGKCGDLHGRARDKVTDGRLRESISHREGLCARLAQGERPEDLFTLQEAAHVA